LQKQAELHSTQIRLTGDKMKQMTIYNTAKHRLETVDIEITDKNSTWFDDRTDTCSIYGITDFQGGLLN